MNRYFLLRHLSLQYFTSSQTFSHFLRQAKGRLHTTHIFSGRSDFLTPRMLLETKDLALCFLSMLSDQDTDRIIEMAWEDRTPFEAIEAQFGVTEDQVVEIMRKNLKLASWKRWRERVNGRKTKFAALRSEEVDRFKCDRQRSISNNKVSKR